MANPETAPPARARRPFDWIGDLDATDVALRLTLLTLLLRPVGSPTVRAGILALAALGLAVPAWLRRPGLWAALTALTIVRVATDWSLIFEDGWQSRR